MDWTDWWLSVPWNVWKKLSTSTVAVNHRMIQSELFLKSFLKQEMFNFQQLFNWFLSLWTIPYWKCIENVWRFYFFPINRSNHKIIVDFFTTGFINCLKKKKLVVFKTNTLFFLKRIFKLLLFKLQLDTLEVSQLVTIKPQLLPWLSFCLKANCHRWRTMENLSQLSFFFMTLTTTATDRARLLEEQSLWNHTMHSTTKLV